MFVFSGRYVVAMMKPCVSCLLEVKGWDMRGVGQVADKKGYTDQAVNIIS
jgi:hypothetical protein